MTIIDQPIAAAIERLRPVSFDVYRDIHKGIRRELFALVSDAGRLDPGDAFGAAELAGHVQRTVDLLLDHAHHEDAHIQPAIVRYAPQLADTVADDHERLDAAMVQLVTRAEETRDAGGDRRHALHELYLDLASFTSDYLAHQDLEERQVADVLDRKLGFDGLLAIHGAIVGTMPPAELTAGLAVMFPAMNVDDRTELLGGMQATAPAEVFEGVWSLATSVLTVNEHRAVAARLGIA
jgi:Hemerythrin HHE cation binding domain